MALSLSACSPMDTEGSPSSEDDAPSPTAPNGSPKVPAPVVDLMLNASMSEEAQRLFLAADPSIEGKAALRGNCRNTSAAHVLGCFLVTRECRAGANPSTCSRKTRIHLLQIDRADVRDLIYVSAAHEMLHAAYEVIPDRERAQVDRQLDAALPHIDQCRLSANLAAYSGRVGEERLSELHSILATEFASLPAGLQAHYSKYFLNRQLVVQAHDRTLGGREQEICGLRANIEQLEARIATLRAQLQGLRSSGNLRSYNAQVPAFNAQVSNHNRLVSTHNSKVREYNQVLASLGSSVDVLQQREAVQPPPQ